MRLPPPPQRHVVAVDSVLWLVLPQLAPLVGLVAARLGRRHSSVPVLALVVVELLSVVVVRLQSL